MRFDPRSLALFRIALGLLVLSQSVVLSRDFAAFYQVGGVSLPPASFLPQAIVESIVRGLLMGVLPMAALGLIAGFLTRWANLVCFVGLIAVQQANEQILQGGDVLLRLLLFWSLFLPLSQVWSLDAKHKRISAFVLPLTTELATWALTLQICFVYWFAALLKSDPLWTQSGNALFFALNIEHFTTPFGLYLRQYPDLLRVLTFATLILEVAGPCLLFIPFRRDAFRLAAVVFFVGFHLVGMQSLLRIGLFPWVCTTAWLVFLPGSFWDWLLVRLGRFLHLKTGKARGGNTTREKKARNVSSKPTWDYAWSIFVVLSLADVLAWNVASANGDDARHWMQRHDTFGNVLRLEQRWNMYAPFPRKEHGWIVVPADLANGTQVDLFTGQSVTWDKPVDSGASFGDDRWRRYLSNLFDDQNPQALQNYANYLVRHWNQSHGVDQKVQAVTITFMRQETQSDLTITLPEKEILYFQTY